MARNSYDICDKNVSVKISHDRGKTSVSVVGGVSASYAVESVRKNIPDMNYENFLKPDITAVPGGYVINILGRRSVRDYLAERPAVLCDTIFSVAETVKKIFDTYGKMIFSQLLFDYSVIFIKNDSLRQLDFVFVPFSDNDVQRAKFSEFLRVLFLHMEETDIIFEEAVKKLIKIISEWESSGCEKRYCADIEKCFLEHRNMLQKNRKKDILSKGSFAIRGLFGGLSENADYGSKKIFRIAVSSDENGFTWSYVYDLSYNCFFCYDKPGEDNKASFESLKIGREQEWAVMHIADMTVSGRYGEIFFEDNEFVFRAHKKVLPDNAVLSDKKTPQILKSGQKMQIGKHTYTVKVRSAKR